MKGTKHEDNSCFVPLCLREGTRQMGMQAFPLADAREREKLAERVSHRYGKGE